jgi:hypothetical protein
LGAESNAYHFRSLQESKPSKSRAGASAPGRWMDGCTRADARGRAHQIPWLQEREGRRGGGLARDRECHPDRIHFGHGDSRGHPDTIRSLSPAVRWCWCWCSRNYGWPPFLPACNLLAAPAVTPCSACPAMLRLWMTMRVLPAWICALDSIYPCKGGLRVLPAWIRSAEAGAARFHISV